MAARSYGGVAQLGEHLPCKQGVMSSNLTVSTEQRSCSICTLKTSYREIIDEIFLIFKNKLFKTSENNKPKVETKVFISSNKQSISKEVETKKKM